jgi:hypothetical protein
MFTIATVSAILILGFQNCANPKFTEAEDGPLSFKGTLVPLDGTSDSLPTSTGASAPTAAPATASKTSGICILQGSGQSQKLGYLSNDQIGTATSSAKSICMSEKACLNIVSNYFDSGFCKDMSGKIALQDGQVAELLAAQFVELR